MTKLALNIPITIDIPTINIIDWDTASDETIGFTGGDIQNLYNKDVNSLPIATLPDVYLNVKQRVWSSQYPQFGADIGNLSDGFSTGDVTQKVVFPQSMVLPIQNPTFNGEIQPLLTTFEFPTVTVPDFSNTSGQSEDTSQIIAGGYTKDVKAIPIIVPDNNYLPVKIGLIEQKYYAGNGKYGAASSLKVSLNESAVVRVEDTTPVKDLIKNHNRTTGINTYNPPYRALSVTAFSSDVTIDGQAIPENMTVEVGSDTGEQIVNSTVVEGTDYFVTIITA